MALARTCANDVVPLQGGVLAGRQRHAHAHAQWATGHGQRSDPSVGGGTSESASARGAVDNERACWCHCCVRPRTERSSSTGRLDTWDVPISVVARHDMKGSTMNRLWSNPLDQSISVVVTLYRD